MYRTMAVFTQGERAPQRIGYRSQGLTWGDVKGEGGGHTRLYILLEGEGGSCTMLYNSGNWGAAGLGCPLIFKVQDLRLGWGGWRLAGLLQASSVRVTVDA